MLKPSVSFAPTAPAALPALLAALALVALAVSPAAAAGKVPVPAAAAGKVPVPAQGCYLSAYHAGSQTDFEALLQKELAVGMFYVNWDTDFPKSTCDAYARLGSIPHLSWEPFGAANSNQAIIDGKRDAYIRKYARDVKAWGKPLFIRWGLEMNGDWYDWDGTHSGGATLDGFGDPQKADGPERFVAAHRHIHDLFREEGADNVSWVFAPNIISYPTVAWNRIEAYYPGEAYIDWLGLDGYNWGNTNGGRWQSFDQVFQGPYATVAALGPQPIMIAEFASAELGGDKAAWVKDAFARMKASYPRLKAVTWFHVNKETDWRINSSEATLAALRAAVADPYFLSSVPTATALAGSRPRPGVRRGGLLGGPAIAGPGSARVLRVRPGGGSAEWTLQGRLLPSGGPSAGAAEAAAPAR